MKIILRSDYEFVLSVDSINGRLNTAFYLYGISCEGRLIQDEDRQTGYSAH